MSGKSQPGKVFISYRRADTLEDARRLKHLLSERFGAANVFLDEKNIETGDQWATTIKHFLDEATAVIVLMGPKWMRCLEERYEKGEKTDWVRLELGRALERQREGDLQALMPVLLSGAEGPTSDNLAEALKPLIDGLTELQCGVYSIEDHESMAKLELELVLKGMMRDTRHAKQCLDSCAKKLEGLLAHADLQPLAAAWKTAPLQPSLDADLIACFGEFEHAIKASTGWPDLASERQRERRELLCQVVGVLLQMCADHGKTYLWSGQHNALAWPTRCAGTAAGLKVSSMGFAPTLRLQNSADPGVERVYPVPDHELGLADIDPCVLADQQGRVAQEVIKQHPLASKDASLNAETPSALQIRYAKSIVRRDQARGHAHFLAQRVAQGASASALAVKLAKELDMVLIPYSGDEQSLFRHHENEDVYLEAMTALAAIPDFLR